MTWHEVSEEQCNRWPCWTYDGFRVSYATKPYRGLPVNGIEWWFEPGVTHWKEFPPYPKPPAESKRGILTCRKCKKKRKWASKFTIGEESFSLCSECDDSFKCFPYSILHFLSEKTVDKYIREAKECRARGESPWAKE